MMPQLAGSLPPTWETERSAQCEPGRAPTVADVQRELGDGGGEALTLAHWLVLSNLKRF